MNNGRKLTLRSIWCMLGPMPHRILPRSSLSTGVVLYAICPLAAQWLKYPSAGVPRKADGSVNMSAPTPRMGDGKPDLSGIWAPGEPDNGRAGRAADTDRPVEPG